MLIKENSKVILSGNAANMRQTDKCVFKVINMEEAFIV
jgi:hypothetical protein